MKWLKITFCAVILILTFTVLGGVGQARAIDSSLEGQSYNGSENYGFTAGSNTNLHTYQTGNQDGQFRQPESGQADETPNVAGTDELYSEQYKASGADELNKALPKNTMDLLGDLELSPEDPNWVSKITPKSVFKLIWDFLRDGGKTPFITAAALLAVMLLASALNGFLSEKGIGDQFANFVVIAAATTIIMPLFEVMRGSAGAIKGTAMFMLSFVPVYAGIAISSGLVTTVGSFSTLMLFVSELLMQLVSFAYVPITGAYLALNVTAGVSPLSGLGEIAESIKKAATWMLTVCLAVFLGVLGVQTTVGAAADNLTIRTTKLIVSGSVPVLGSAIGESLATVKSCLTLLRSSVGIYGVVAIVLIMLPILAELLIWRLALMLSIGTSQVLELPKMRSFLKAVDGALSIIIGILIFVLILFVISLTMVILAGGGQ